MKVSVVVPTRNSGRTLERCLRSIRHQRGPTVEIVVVDNSSTDDTWRIAEGISDVVMAGGPERSAQRNVGAARSTGELLVFVDADMVLSPGVLLELCDLRARGATAMVIPERSFGLGFWARCKALEKLIVLGDPAVEAARAFERSAFFGAGGYDGSLTACEDWDLADRISTDRPGPERTAPARTLAEIWHDEGELRLRSTFDKKRYYGRWVDRWLRSAPAHRRRRALGAAAPHLVLQPVTAAGLVVMKSVEAAGFAAGLLDARRDRRPEARR